MGAAAAARVHWRACVSVASAATGCGRKADDVAKLSDRDAKEAREEKKRKVQETKKPKSMIQKKMNT
jgi:hypothetical protein